VLKVTDNIQKACELLRLNNSDSVIKSEILLRRFLEFAKDFFLGEGCFVNEVLRREGIEFDLPVTNIV
jgi:hypothetical protein